MEPAVSATFEKLINEALATLEDVAPVASVYDHSGATKRSLDARLLAEAASEHGLGVITLTEQTQLIVDQDRMVGVHQNMTWALKALDRFVTNDKQLTKRVLAEAGLPVTRGRLVSSPAEAVEVRRELDCPVVVKPLSGSNGKGITVGVVEDAEVMRAAEVAFALSSTVLVEECVPSIDLRIAVAAGQAVAAMMRVPANVMGDGVSTIEELIAEKNTYRAANAYHKYVPIVVTADTEAHLASYGLDVGSVLEPGRRVFLHYKANLSSGGDSINITDRIHPDFLRLAERAMKCFPSADHGGVDILAERLDQPPEAQRCVMCEINCNNDLPIHVFPLFGTSIDVAAREIETDFPPVSRLRRRRNAQIDGLRHLVARREVASWAGRSRRARQRAYARPTAWDDTLSALTEPPVDSLTPAADSPRELDQLQLAAAIERSGGQVRTYRRLVIVEQPDHDVVLEHSGRSIFTGAVAGRPELLYEVLDRAGLPASIARRFTPRQLRRAKALVAGQSGPWNVRPARAKPSASARFSFESERTLQAAWEKLADRPSGIIVEQAADGLAVDLLLHEGEVVASLLCVPVTLVGDGISTVEQLVERKRQERAEHPYYRHLPVRGVTDANLAGHELTASTVLAAGVRVPLGRSPLPEAGGESIGLVSCPVPGLADLANTARRLLGSPPLASVTFVARPQDVERGCPPWLLARFDCDPVLASFAWPWRGRVPGAELYRPIAHALLAGGQYRLSRTPEPLPG